MTTLVNPGSLETRTPPARRLARGRRGLRLLALVLTLSFCGGSPLLSASPAQADGELEEEQSIRAKRDTWQNRYRKLLREKAQYEAHRDKSYDDLATATRRNYPRGEVRQQLRLAGERAEEELAKVEKDLAIIHERARLDGAPPAWLDEVESETLEPSVPAAADDRASDREGRNPLYFKDDEE